jgi:hypothetical protein
MFSAEKRTEGREANARFSSAATGSRGAHDLECRDRTARL